MSAIRWSSSSTPSPIRNTASPTARCATLSPDSFSAQEQARDPNSSLAMLPCGCGAVLSRADFDRSGRAARCAAGFAVSPGMPVTADVKVGQRTVLKYLLGVMLPVGQEAMREP